MRTLKRILSPDQEEVKSTFWVNNDAQRLLRSLIRLRKGHHIVSPKDILDDLCEVEHDPLSEEALAALLGRLCDISLISKHSEGEERFDVPMFDELAQFLNPEMGDVPDEDYEYSQSSESENESSPWSSDESSFDESSFDESSFLGSKEPRIILNSDDDTGLSSVSMTTYGNKERKTRSTIKAVSLKKLTNEAFTNIGDIPETIVSDRIKKRSFIEQPQKKHRNMMNNSSSGEPSSSTSSIPLGRKSPRKITPTKFYHNLPVFRGNASGGLTNPSVSNDEERALTDSTQKVFDDHTHEPFTNVNDFQLVSEFDRPKTKSFIEQPEEKQHVNYTGSGNIGKKRASSMPSSSKSSGKRKGSLVQAPHGSVLVWAREGNHDGAKDHPAYLLPQDYPECDDNERSKNENDSENGKLNDNDDHGMVMVQWVSTGTRSRIHPHMLSDDLPSRRTRPQITRDDLKRANYKGPKRTLSFEIKPPILKSTNQVEIIDLT